jgi:hypothetical protein
VALAEQGHRFKACVAEETAGSGYCSAEKSYYHGIRVHCQCLNISVWRAPVIIMAKYLIRFCRNCTTMDCMAIKPINAPTSKPSGDPRTSPVSTPVKKRKGQRYLDIGAMAATTVSRVRRPMKHYLPGLKKRQALDAPVKCVLIWIDGACLRKAGCVSVFLEFLRTSLLIHI